MRMKTETHQKYSRKQTDAKDGIYEDIVNPEYVHSSQILNLDSEYGPDCGQPTVFLESLVAELDRRYRAH